MRRPRFLRRRPDPAPVLVHRLDEPLAVPLHPVIAERLTRGGTREMLAGATVHLTDPAGAEIAWGACDAPSTTWARIRAPGFDTPDEVYRVTVVVEGDFTAPRTSHRFRVVSPEGITIVDGYAYGTIVAVWQANPPSVFFTFDLDLSAS